MRKETTAILRKFVAECEAIGKTEYVFSEIKGMKRFSAEWRIRDVYGLRPLRSIPHCGTSFRHFWSVAELKDALERNET